MHGSGRALWKQVVTKCTQGVPKCRQPAVAGAIRQGLAVRIMLGVARQLMVLGATSTNTGSFAVPAFDDRLDAGEAESEAGEDQD